MNALKVKKLKDRISDFYVNEWNPFYNRYTSNSDWATYPAIICRLVGKCEEIDDATKWFEQSDDLLMTNLNLVKDMPYFGRFVQIF